MKKTKACHCCEGSGKELDHIAVGADMRALRLKAKRSLEFVASKLGFTKAYICDLELGRRNWSEAKLAQYKKACA